MHPRTCIQIFRPGLLRKTEVWPQFFRNYTSGIISSSSASFAYLMATLVKAIRQGFALAFPDKRSYARTQPATGNRPTEEDMLMLDEYWQW